MGMGLSVCIIIKYAVFSLWKLNALIWMKELRERCDKK